MCLLCGVLMQLGLGVEAGSDVSSFLSACGENAVACGGGDLRGGWKLGVSARLGLRLRDWLGHSRPLLFLQIWLASRHCPDFVNFILRIMLSGSTSFRFGDRWRVGLRFVSSTVRC